MIIIIVTINNKRRVESTEVGERIREGTLVRGGTGDGGRRRLAVAEVRSGFAEKLGIGK